eukprot:GHRR01022812.1.p1 GENE.GHRR01022812.1~~GHRR01022812.1.p1  ORF type:complete len:360 (+),score=95.99 GHRR01022812.1:1339-2418(+)
MRLRVGVDPTKGGAITHLSSPIMPKEWANVNLVNTWDSGRLIQQSYYGCEDSSCWYHRPWRWNPVQGGSWQNSPPKLLASTVDANKVSISAMPRNWGSQQLLDDVIMSTQTELLENVVKVRFTMQYTGAATHPARHQEVPAIFVNRRLNVLAVYVGNTPWTNGMLNFTLPGQVGQYYKPTERWGAYVDIASGFGVGVYTSVATELVAYRIGLDNSTAQSDCSYLAPLVTATIVPNTEFSYNAYLAVGRVDEMRQWFATIAATVRPDLSAQRRIALASGGGAASPLMTLPAGPVTPSGNTSLFHNVLPSTLVVDSEAQNDAAAVQAPATPNLLPATQVVITFSPPPPPKRLPPLLPPSPP